jgi:hypothetical protein
MQRANNNVKKTTAEIDRIIRNASFSMEVEGFHIPSAQKEDWRKVLLGELDSQVLMNQYIEKAHRYGVESYDAQ